MLPYALWSTGLLLFITGVFLMVALAYSPEPEEEWL